MYQFVNVAAVFFGLWIMSATTGVTGPASADGDTDSAVTIAGADLAEFVTSDGRFDLDAARAAGFEGSLNLEEHDVRIDPRTGAPLFSPIAGSDPDDIDRLFVYHLHCAGLF